MANITLYVPDDVDEEMRSHPDIKWTQVAREALIEKARRLRKLAILEKYLDHRPFDEGDLFWMEQNDWHPVDERELRKEFVQKLEKARRSRSRKISSLDKLG